MPSLYAQYIKEREDFEIVEIPNYAFATYKISGSECYLRDLFVVPEQRRKGFTYTLENLVARIAVSRGCKNIVGSVVPSSKNSHIMKECMLSNNYRVLKEEENIIYFVKELI